MFSSLITVREFALFASRFSNLDSLLLPLFLPQSCVSLACQPPPFWPPVLLRMLLRSLPALVLSLQGSLLPLPRRSFWGPEGNMITPCLKPQSPENAFHARYLSDWDPLSSGLGMFPWQTDFGILSGTLQSIQSPQQLQDCTSMGLFMLLVFSKNSPHPTLNPLVQHPSSHLQVFPLNSFATIPGSCGQVLAVHTHRTPWCFPALLSTCVKSS